MKANTNHIPEFNIFESKDSDALAKGINKAIIKIDDSMSYKDFALAVGKILRDDYGKHTFKMFMDVLHKLILGIKLPVKLKQIIARLGKMNSLRCFISLNMLVD